MAFVDNQIKLQLKILVFKWRKHSNCENRTYEVSEYLIQIPTTGMEIKMALIF